MNGANRNKAPKAMHALKPLQRKAMSRVYKLLDIHVEMQRKLMGADGFLQYDEITRFYELNKKTIDALHLRINALMPEYFVTVKNDKGYLQPVQKPKETWKDEKQPEYEMMEGKTQEEYGKAVEAIKNEPVEIYRI